VADRAAIEAILPHRDPFLFVERVLAWDASTLTGEWDIPEGLDVFRGHYPGEPVLPGVLITEFALQCGAVLIYHTSQEDREHPGVPVLTRVNDARFKKVVRPGETLRAEVELTERVSTARYCKARVTSDGRLVARLAFTLAVAPRESLS